MDKIFYFIGFILLFTNCTVKDVNETSSVNKEKILDREVSDVIDKLYSSINYYGNEHPELELMRSLFLENAKMIPVADSSYTKMSVDDFIKLYSDQIESGLIKKATEYEIHQTGDQYQNIAQVFSTYKTETVTADDTLRKRGINSIQLLKAEGEWKIASLIWFDETTDYPIPSHFLDQ